MRSVHDIVTAGMAYMNEYHPDWEEHIDLRLLNLSSCRDCILGQVFEGGFIDVLNRLEVSDKSIDLGFVTGGSYPALTQEWRHQIKAKLSA